MGRSQGSLHVHFSKQTEPERCGEVRDDTGKCISARAQSVSQARAVLLQIETIAMPRLPFGVRAKIASYLGGTTYEQAAARRDRLMEERKAAEPEQKPSSLHVPSVSFCEH